MQHENSLAHAEAHLDCPVSKSSKLFKAPSSVAQHVESGCHAGINRHDVTAAVHRLNVPEISVEKRILGYQKVPKRWQSLVATEASYNPVTRKYQCPVCQKPFKTLVSLNVHLTSAAHDDAEFKCPKCQVEFKLISALIQHVESKACSRKRAGIGSGSTTVDIGRLPMRLSWT